MENVEIKVKELEYCEYEVNYIAKKEVVEDKRKDVLPMFKRMPVKGFRKGKANLSVISNVYKKQIEDALKKALMEDAVHDYMFEYNKELFGAPVFKTNKLETEFSCVFTVQTKPIFELKEFKGLSFPKPVVDFDHISESEKYFENLRLKYGEQIPFNETDVVANNDYIVISYECFVDGEKNENLSSESELVFVGNSNYKQFDEKLVGLKVGESTEFTMNISNSKFDNKDLLFKAQVISGSKIIKVPLDDELAKLEGKESLQELRDYVLGAFSGRAEDIVKQKANDALINKLLNDYDFKVPDFIVNREVMYLMMTNKKTPDSITEKETEVLRAKAVANLKLAFILEKIRSEDPDAQLSDQELQSILVDNMKRGKLNQENLYNPAYLQIISNKIKNEYCLDYVLKTCIFVE